MKDVIKLTQGNRKLKQYIEDLCNNKNFVLLYDQIVDNPNSKKQKELLKYIAKKYGIDRRLFEIIRMKIEHNNLIWGDTDDVCEIVDNYLDVVDYEEEQGLIPIKKDLFRHMHLTAFPISIEIHELASKRDILDFVEKRWDMIENYLEVHRRKDGIRIRKRKNKKLYDFIWKIWKKKDSNNMNIKELKKEVNKKFPDNNLVYYDIYKIIDLERRRRHKDSSIGI